MHEREGKKEPTIFRLLLQAKMLLILQRRIFVIFAQNSVNDLL